MKPILPSFLILALSVMAQARLIPHWTDQELLEKSDLVVVATPISSSDTLERADLPGFPAQRVIGVETGFEIVSVIKGDEDLKNFILHHYRADGNTVPNGPDFISFKPGENRSFRLHLIKEEDGRYAPTVGQIDPGMQGITEHADAGNPHSTKPSATASPSDALRFTVELTDGSRWVGSPVTDSFPLMTSLGPLTLKWHLLKSVEKTGDGSGFSVVFVNDDRANGTPGAEAFTLRAMLGDLTVPLALTRRIRVQSLAGGGGPVAYWSFNDPANLGADDSGNGHTLTVMGAQSTEGRIGKAAATCENQGAGEYLKIDSHPDLQFSGDFTLAVWAWRSKPIYDGDQLIAKEGEFSLRRYQFPTERYDVELCSKQGLQLAKVSETKSGLPLETWTLIVVSRKDDKLSIRVNDLPAVETEVADGETGGDKPFFMGCSVVGYPWQGKVDEVKKWNRALSEDEQRKLFQVPPAKP